MCRNVPGSLVALDVSNAAWRIMCAFLDFLEALPVFYWKRGRRNDMDSEVEGCQRGRRRYVSIEC